MKKETGGQAFPISGSQYQHTRGMALRDYFAAKAMEGFIHYAATNRIYTPPDNELAKMAYDLADAMLRAREGA
jgi:hypothetical protein